MSDDFSVRWGIEIDEAVRVKELATRISITLSQVGIMGYWENIEFRRLLSIQYGQRIELPDRKSFSSFSTFDEVETDDEFKVTQLADKIESCTKSFDLAKIIESILNAARQVDGQSRKAQLKILNADKLYNSILYVIKSFGFSPFILVIIEERYITVPTFATGHINHTLNRVIPNLVSHPRAHNHIIKAVKALLEDGDLRVGLDEARLGLELFLKSRLGNTKNLSNQTAALGTEMSNLGISSNTVTLYNNILSWYDKFQNERVKHNFQGVSQKEAEFMFFQTISLIDLLL